MSTIYILLQEKIDKYKDFLVGPALAMPYTKQVHEKYEVNQKDLTLN